jgi:hypothetical protein
MHLLTRLGQDVEIVVKSKPRGLQAHHFGSRSVHRHPRRRHRLSFPANLPIDDGARSDGTGCVGVRNALILAQPVALRRDRGAITG